MYSDAPPSCRPRYGLPASKLFTTSSRCPGNQTFAFGWTWEQKKGELRKKRNNQSPTPGFCEKHSSAKVGNSARTWTISKLKAPNIMKPPGLLASKRSWRFFFHERCKIVAAGLLFGVR